MASFGPIWLFGTFNVDELLQGWLNLSGQSASFVLRGFGVHRWHPGQYCDEPGDRVPKAGSDLRGMVKPVTPLKKTTTREPLCIDGCCPSSLLALRWRSSFNVIFH